MLVCASSFLVSSRAAATVAAPPAARDRRTALRVAVHSADRSSGSGGATPLDATPHGNSGCSGIETRGRECGCVDGRGALCGGGAERDCGAESGAQQRWVAVDRCGQCTRVQSNSRVRRMIAQRLRSETG